MLAALPVSQSAVTESKPNLVAGEKRDEEEEDEEDTERIEPARHLDEQQFCV